MISHLLKICSSLICRIKHTVFVFDDIIGHERYHNDVRRQDLIHIRFRHHTVSKFAYIQLLGYSMQPKQKERTFRIDSVTTNLFSRQWTINTTQRILSNLQSIVGFWFLYIFVPISGPICNKIDVGEMFKNDDLDDVYFKSDKSMAKSFIDQSIPNTTLINNIPSPKFRINSYACNT